MEQKDEKWQFDEADLIIETFVDRTTTTLTKAKELVARLRAELSSSVQELLIFGPWVELENLRINTMYTLVIAQHRSNRALQLVLHPITNEFYFLREWDKLPFYGPVQSDQVDVSVIDQILHSSQRRCSQRLKKKNQKS